MFLRTIAIVTLSAISLHASAKNEIGGLHNTAYKLKSFTKNFKGKRVESRAGRAQFCGEKINPRLTEAEGKLTLELNAGIGFEWRNVNDNPKEMNDGCRYPVEQAVESSRDRSSLVLVNGEDCGRNAPVVGSQRDTVEIKEDQIIYSSESVIKDRAGLWQADEAKEGFTCTWTAVK